MFKYFKILGLFIMIICIPAYLYLNYNSKLTDQDIINNFFEKDVLYIHGDIHATYNDKYEKDFLFRKIINERINQSKIFGKLKFDGEEYTSLINIYSKYKKEEIENAFKIDDELINNMIENIRYDEINNQYIANIEEYEINEFENNIDIKMSKNENKITKAILEIKGKYNRKLNMDVNYIVKLEIEP